MARNGKDTVFEAVELRLIMSPFRKIMVYFLAAIFLATISVFALFFFVDKEHTIYLLSQYHNSEINQVSLMKQLSKSVYEYLHWLCFDLTQIKQSLSETPIKGNPGYSIHLYFLKHYESWVKLDWVLQVISFRLAIIVSYFLMVGSTMYFVAIIDGGVKRAIRRDLIGRESAGLYHRMKYFNYVLIVLGFELYIAAPLYLPEYFIIFFFALSAFLYSIQIKYYKKYF